MPAEDADLADRALPAERVRGGELYDLENDPEENRNLWDEPGSATVRTEILHRLARAMIHYTDPSPNPTALA